MPRKRHKYLQYWIKAAIFRSCDKPKEKPIPREKQTVVFLWHGVGYRLDLAIYGLIGGTFLLLLLSFIQSGYLSAYSGERMTFFNMDCWDFEHIISIPI